MSAGSIQAPRKGGKKRAIIYIKPKECGQINADSIPYTPSSSFFRPLQLKSLDLRQAHKDGQHLRVIRGPESRHRVPPTHGSEAGSSAALVPTRGDVVQDRGVGVQGRVEEADGTLAGVGALLVDEGDDAAECGRRR